MENANCIPYNKSGPVGVALFVAYTTHFDTMQRKSPERCIR